MDIGDDYWGLYRGYYRDPFPHSLLRTRRKIPINLQPQKDSFNESVRQLLLGLEGTRAFGFGEGLILVT